MKKIIPLQLTLISTFLIISNSTFACDAIRHIYNYSADHFNVLWVVNSGADSPGSITGPNGNTIFVLMPNSTTEICYTYPNHMMEGSLHIEKAYKPDLAHPSWPIQIVKNGSELEPTVTGSWIQDGDVNIYPNKLVDGDFTIQLVP